MMEGFVVGRSYQSRYGTERDRITVVDRDEDYIYFTRDWVKDKVFRERYHPLQGVELLRTDPWTLSNEIVA